MAKQCGFLVFFAAASSLALGAAVEGAGRDAQSQADLSIVQNLKEPEHMLTVCNAYAADEPLRVDILRLAANAADLAYKECRDFHSQLKAEDTVEFKIGEDEVGSFAVSEVPAVASKLLLVAHRRAGSMTATFKSHVFTPDSIELAEVAVLDVLGQGVKGHKVQIQHAQKPKAKGDQEDNAQLMQHAPEELTLNAVSPIRAGEYKVFVPGSTMNLKARGGETYVVLRMGESKGPDGQRAYPEEVVVFPQVSRSGATALSAIGGLLIAAAFQVAHFVVHL